MSHLTNNYNLNNVVCTTKVLDIYNTTFTTQRLGNHHKCCFCTIVY